MKTVLDFNVRMQDFIRESKAELKKVSWPTKKQVWYSTLVVVALTVVMGVYLGLVDFALTALLRGLAAISG
ncbi:MAG: preprotein translocase subunit SecE [Synergistaceae bacterium]|jgi:preprotein translocase subunit SecE|nr:preprotein translocase subunit SecE [Synergistaceae bacterium]